MQRLHQDDKAAAKDFGPNEVGLEGSTASGTSYTFEYPHVLGVGKRTTTRTTFNCFMISVCELYSFL